MMSVQPEAPAPILPPAVHAFLVGQDAQGRWLAVETHGLGGGLFRDRRAAMHYAAAETDHRPGAVRLSAEPLALALGGRAT